MELGEGVSRGDVFLVYLHPARGSEIRKTRPCVVVSPDELNAHLKTFIIAPLTTGGHKYPFRIPCNFMDKEGFLVCDQIRTVDRDRLIRKLGRIPESELQATLSVLCEMFAP